MTHFIEYWQDCGHVAAQCRCPAWNKLERHRPGKCEKCKALTSERYEQLWRREGVAQAEFDGYQGA